MALTITEQMKMIKGDEAGFKPTSNTLIDLVHQSAMKYGYDFYLGYKVFATVNTANPPVAINQDATNYVTKMLAITSRVFMGDQVIIGALKRIIVTIIGTSTITVAQVNGATDAGWEAVIAQHMPRAFELLAGVTKAELSNYTAVAAV